jgi:hypothetical protein
MKSAPSIPDQSVAVMQAKARVDQLVEALRAKGDENSSAWSLLSEECLSSASSGLSTAAATLERLERLATLVLAKTRKRGGKPA